MTDPIRKADLVAIRNAVIAINQAEVLPTQAELIAYWVQSIKETAIGSAAQGYSSYTLTINQNISSRSHLGLDIVADVVAELETAFVTTGPEALNINYSNVLHKLIIDWN